MKSQFQYALLLSCALICAAIMFVSKLSYSNETSFHFARNGQMWEAVFSSGDLQIGNQPQVVVDTAASLERERKINKLLDRIDELGASYRRGRRYRDQGFSTVRVGPVSPIAEDSSIVEQERIFREFKSMGYTPNVLPVAWVRSGGYDHQAYVSSRLFVAGASLRSPIGAPRIPVPAPGVIARPASFTIPFSAIISLPAVLFAILARRMSIAHHRRLRNLCLACGYDLRAGNGRCPECGLIQFESLQRRQPISRFSSVVAANFSGPILAMAGLCRLYPLPAFIYFCGVIVLLHAPIEFYRAIEAAFGNNLVRDSSSTCFILAAYELAIGLVAIFVAIRLSMIIEWRRKQQSWALRDEGSLTA